MKATTKMVIDQTIMNYQMFSQMIDKYASEQDGYPSELNRICLLLAKKIREAKELKENGFECE